MKIQELPLTAREPPHVDGSCNLNTHPLERWTVSHRRDNELAIIFKANEAAVEEMINAGR